MESHILGLDKVTGFIVTGPVGAPVGARALGMTTPEKWLGLRDAVVDRHGVSIADGHPVAITKRAAASIGALLRASVACRTAMDLDRLKAAWLREPAARVTDLCFAQRSGQVSLLSPEVTYTMLCREMPDHIPLRLQMSGAAADALALTVGAGSGFKPGFLAWHWYRNNDGEFAFHVLSLGRLPDVRFMISSFGTGMHSSVPQLFPKTISRKLPAWLETFCIERSLSAHQRLALGGVLQRSLKAVVYPAAGTSG